MRRNHFCSAWHTSYKRHFQTRKWLQLIPSACDLWTAIVEKLSTPENHEFVTPFHRYGVAAIKQEARPSTFVIGTTPLRNTMNEDQNSKDHLSDVEL